MTSYNYNKISTSSSNKAPTSSSSRGAGPSRNPNDAPRYGSGSTPERQPMPNSSGSRSGSERSYGNAMDNASRSRGGNERSYGSAVDNASRSRGGPPPAPGGGGVRNYTGASREGRSQYSGSSGGNYRQQQYGNEEDEDDDIDAIKARITEVKKDTLDSTRNSLRTLEQTEKVGTATLSKLGQQTEQLNRIDRTLEMTNIQAENSIEDTAKLRTLNKSIFHVHVKNPFSGKKRREEELA
ncbi:Protein transport protein S9 plasma membrane t-SNARE, partial [Coemansia aciculifera]